MWVTSGQHWALTHMGIIVATLLFIKECPTRGHMNLKKPVKNAKSVFAEVVWTKLKVDHRKRRRVLSREMRSLSSLYDCITSCLLKPLHSALFMFPSSHCASLSWLFSFHLNTFPSNAFFFTLIHFFPWADAGRSCWSSTYWLLWRIWCCSSLPFTLGEF